MRFALLLLREQSALCHGELESGVVSVHLLAAEVHRVAAAHRPVVVELVLRFDEEAKVLVRCGSRVAVWSPALLIGVEYALVESRRRRAFHAEV